MGRALQAESPAPGQLGGSVAVTCLLPVARAFGTHAPWPDSCTETGGRGRQGRAWRKLMAQPAECHRLPHLLHILAQIPCPVQRTTKVKAFHTHTPEPAVTKLRERERGLCDVSWQGYTTFKWKVFHGGPKAKLSFLYKGLWFGPTWGPCSHLDLSLFKFKSPGMTPPLQAGVLHKTEEAAAGPTAEALPAGWILSLAGWPLQIPGDLGK